jgi:hypothetical protein
MADVWEDESDDEGADASPGPEAQNDPAFSQIWGGVLNPRTFPIWGPGNGAFAPTSGQGRSATPQIDGGVLNPRTFPLGWLTPSASPQADGQGGLATSQIDGGVLDPRTFPLGWLKPSASPTAGGQGGRATPQIDGGVLDPRTFPTAQKGFDAGHFTSVQRQTPILTGPLDTNPHAEALDGLRKSPAEDNTIVINGQIYSVLKARTYDPARSNGVTAMPDPNMVTAAIAGRSAVAVPYGRRERAGYLVAPPAATATAGVDGPSGSVPRLPMVIEPRGVKTRVEGEANTATFRMPNTALAGIHGHIDSGPDGASDGMVDNADVYKGYGDTFTLSLQPPVPMFTVSHDRVGWHGLDQGQLKFVYPKGALTPDQIWRIQDNLDREQLHFLRPK